MAIRNALRGELLEILEWTEDHHRDILVWRYPDEDREIKRGAQLVVREGQVAQLVYLGQFAESFGPGQHRLTTDNVPLLTTLKGWKYGFASPFKADVYFCNTRLFTGNKWGTSHPVMLRDPELGVVRARAFGSFDFRIVEPAHFLREVSGSDHDFRLDEFEGAIRPRLLGAFADALASSGIPVADAASRYGELGGALLPLMNPVLRAHYGLELTNFAIENISVPPEVEKALDAKASMQALGDLSEYVKFQLAQGLQDGTGGGGPAGAATELALGFGIAQQLLREQAFIAPATPAAGAAPAVLTPATVAERLAVAEAEVLALLESGELRGKRIGGSWRVPLAAFEEYLAS